MNILITGISRGLGRQLALDYLKAGHNVFGISTKTDGDASLIALYSYKTFSYCRCDLSCEADISDFAAQYINFLDALDVVILNAASMADDVSGNSFSFLTYRNIFEVNLFGSVSLVSKILPAFQKKSQGLFLGISSDCTRKAAIVDKIAYCASKSALNATIEGFRLQFPGDLRFIIVNLSRMLSTRRHLFSTSYESASCRIQAIVRKNLARRSYLFRKNVYNFTILSMLIFMIFEIIPEHILSGIIGFFRSRKGSF